ncbi:MAG TPA: hypothetical protein VMI72_14925 [Roseiarcus sp.]|nr:hypothetical protein [Roseiarcus sp.]
MNVLRELFRDLTGSERALLAAATALVLMLALHMAATEHRSCCGSAPRTFVGLRA